MGVRLSLFAVDQQQFVAWLASFTEPLDWSLLLTMENECERNTPWIRRINRGNRRWWIGSFLDFMDHSWNFNDDDKAAVHAVFAQFLQGQNCGVRVRSSFTPMAQLIKVPPVFDGYDTIGVGLLNPGEVCIMLTAIDLVLADPAAAFHAPPGNVGIAPDTDEEWNAWVLKMLEELIAVKDFPIEQPSIISFID